jgi:hypothetical protein
MINGGRRDELAMQYYKKPFERLCLKRKKIINTMILMEKEENDNKTQSKEKPS